MADKHNAQSSNKSPYGVQQATVGISGKASDLAATLSSGDSAKMKREQLRANAARLQQERDEKAKAAKK